MSLEQPWAADVQYQVIGRSNPPSRYEGFRNPSVQQGPTRCRISLLAFEEPQLLWCATGELLLNGFNGDQLCLFGLPSNLEKLELPQTLCDSFNYVLAPILSEALAVTLPSGATIGLRCGRDASRLFAPAGNGQFLARWVRPELGHNILNHAASGSIALLVASQSAAQQALGARLLLQNGHSDLQTYDFSLPNP